MPNWITTKIKAPKHVIKSMLNSNGEIDFNVILPFTGPHNEWDGISVSAEKVAEVVCGIPLDRNPLLAAMQAESRNKINVKNLSDEEFKQFIGMVENYRVCGYLHSMDFARKVWGTKWNACEQLIKADEGFAKIETAWNYPYGVLIEVSKRFPDDLIDVVFADEDIGSNCGAFVLKDGVIIKQDIAPSFKTMTDEEKKKWRDFAYGVKGWTPQPENVQT